MKILFLHGWHSIVGGVKPTHLKQAGYEVLNPALDDDDFEQAVRTAQAEYDQHEPDVIVGSSRGGAVAMNIDSGNTPLVLLCPAWKNWGSAKKLKPNSVILHSRQDDVIPFADSEELVANSDLPLETLTEIGLDHRLADPESLKVMQLYIRSFVKPASFADRYPRAYHVLPLHSLKSIIKTGKLLSKSDLKKTGVPIKRNSTCDVDDALGLSQFIHLYLPKYGLDTFESLPILKTQLKKSTVSPFPHVVMELPVDDLADWQCGICNFNAAVSRPAYGNIRGGNHARGMAPENIVKHWHGFKNDSPNEVRMRQSYWHDEIVVPLLLRSQITANPRGVGYKTKMPELLLFSPFLLTESVCFHVFSQADYDSATLCTEDLSFKYNRCNEFEWYAEEDRVDPEVRRSINRYLAQAEAEVPLLNYDRLRPSK